MVVFNNNFDSFRADVDKHYSQRYCVAEIAYKIKKEHLVGVGLTRCFFASKNILIKIVAGAEAEFFRVRISTALS